MVCDHVSCALRGYGPDFRKSGPFASLRSVQGAAPLAPLCGYPCALAGKVHPLCVCTFPARLKPNTVTLDRLPDTAKMSFDPTLVRGMSYYTGPIFEISMDEFGGSVGGGGRYDEMIGKFTGNNTCACGFSIGFERIVMLLLERGYEIPTKNGKKAYLIEKNMPADKLLNILKQATEERSAGTQINISIMKKNKKFQKDQLAADGYTEYVEFFNRD